MTRARIGAQNRERKVKRLTSAEVGGSKNITVRSVHLGDNRTAATSPRGAAESDISDDSPVAALDMSLAASRPSPSPPLSQSPTPSSSLLLATGAAALGAAGLGAAPPKKSPQPIPAECKDEAYWERRKRNNESAKRSRELRRIKEQQTALRVLYLEQENLQLRTELTMLRSEVDKLRQLLFVGKHPS